MHTATKVHMVGIGGIGMSALAQLLLRRGVRVTGSDRSVSPTTELLEKCGVSVYNGHHRDAVPADTELLVYSDAVPPENPERSVARERGIPERSYFAMLGEVSTHMRTIAVSGTHGKTTTTGMLAAALRAVGKNPTAVVGSIVRDFRSNFLPGRDDLLVVEACEYRDHLLELSPEVLVITNIELDHTDYFPTLEALQHTFARAASRVPKTGAVVTNPAHPTIAPVLAQVVARVVDYRAVAVPPLRLIGSFNRENAQAAKAAARVAFPDIEERVLDAALREFSGSWRRFEYKGVSPQGAVVYDDYAHHPTAVLKTIAAAREAFPGVQVVVAFHPHLLSRTRSLLHEFSHALGTADQSYVVPIYPAREVDDGSVSHHTLASCAREQGGHVAAVDSFDALYRALSAYGNDTLIITMGAGDVYTVAERLVAGVPSLV